MRTKIVPVRCPIEGCRLDSSCVVDAEIIFTAFPPVAVKLSQMVAVELFDHRMTGEECASTDSLLCKGSGAKVMLGYLP